MIDFENRTIETPRLILRLHRMEDALQVAEICNDQTVYKGTVGLPFPYTPEHAKKWIGQTEHLFETDVANEFAVTDKDTGVLYGCVGLHCHPEKQEGELYFWFGKSYRNKGYATEAVSALIRYAFEVKGYRRVYAGHFAYNPASGRVMQKCGMTYEQTMKKHILKLGNYEDLVIYQITTKKGGDHG